MAVNNTLPNVSYGLSDALLDVFPRPIVSPRLPTANDKAQIGQTWVDTTTNTVYTLTSIVGGSATWTASGSGGGGVEQIDADVGSAVPAGGIIEIAGGANITTSAATNIVTVDVIASPSFAGTVTAGTGINSTTGNIVAVSGQVNAGTSMTATTGLRVSSFGVGVVQSNGTGNFSSTTGANGQILIGGGVAPIWSTITPGTNIAIVNAANSITISALGDLDVAYTTVNTTPYVVLGTDQFLGVDTTGAAITVELPNAPAVGRVFIIKDSQGDASVNNITVTTVSGAIDIDGAVSYTMATDYESLQVLFNGTSYEIF